MRRSSSIAPSALGIAMALLACASSKSADFAVAPAIAVPSTLQPAGKTKLLLRLYAEGSQIYVCKASDDPGPRAYVWTLKAPEAKLYDDAGRLTATHFAGPTWKSTVDGSMVIGAKVSAVPAPVPGAVPWLLLKAVSTTGQGQFSPVVAIQRVDTEGGLAPSGNCSRSSVGAERATPYKASYYFFGEGRSASGKEVEMSGGR